MDSEQSRIDEREDQGQLLELLIRSYNEINEEDYESALSSLSLIEQFVKSQTQEGGYFDNDFVITALHNIAFCLQRLGSLEDCKTYINACLYNMRRRPELKATPSQLLTERLSRGKYECRAYLQLCAIESQQENHREAYEMAQKAINAANNLSHWCLDACLKHIASHAKIVKSNRAQHIQYDLLKSPHYRNFHKLVRSAIPVFRYLNGNSSATPKVLAGTSEIQDLQELSIGELMTLQPTGIEEVKCATSIEVELTEQSIIYKILLFILSYFSLSIELSYLATSDSDNYSSSEAKAWHLKAVELARLLPFNCKLTDYILATYKEFYSVLKVANAPRSTSVKKLRPIGTRAPSRISSRTPDTMARSRSQIKIRSKQTRK